jgi:hypothetical protein
MNRLDGWQGSFSKRHIINSLQSDLAGAAIPS